MRVDEDTAVGPRFRQDPPPSFSAPTRAYTHRQWKSDLRLWQATTSLQKNRQGSWLLRQLKGESRTAAEVVMDDELIQDDGVDLIVKELDRCWEVTQYQVRASKIEKALFETQRDVKTETTYVSYVARRKLNLQQLENALGTPLPAVIKGYATLRDAKLAASSYDKMCGNWWQRILLATVARDPEAIPNNRTVLASAGKRPVEIERPFCPHGHGSMMMQATPQQSLYWECCRMLTKSVPRRVRLAIERNVDENCLNQNHNSRVQYMNLDVRSVGTTRLLEGVALFDWTCDLTDEDAQEATFRACHSVDPGIIIVGITRTVTKSHVEFCMMLCYRATQARCSLYHDPDRS